MITDVFTTSDNNPVVVSIGDMKITSDKCLVESMSVSVDNGIQECQYLDSRKSVLIPTQRTCRISLELVTTDLECWSDVFGGGATNKQISKKNVEDCSVNELLFAVRTKIKQQSMAS